MADLDKLVAQFHAVQDEASAAVREAQTSEQLEETRRDIFGKKGRLSLLLREMSDLSAEERPKGGRTANEVKTALQAAFDARAAQIRAGEMRASVEAEAIDVTLPGIRPRTGALHPLTQTLRKIEDTFTSMGFTIELGPDIEDDFHNFEALNIPADHPARDMQDTFYLASDLLLRTHTSPVQIHTMQSRKPPLAVIAPGKVYRCDADVTHSPMFHQVEGFMVDSDIRFSDLKGVLETFLHQTFGPKTPYRLRPHYFPFTEPSAEVDVLFERRHPNGHMVRDWLEVLGAGMIHPKVLQNCDIDPEKYAGFAFGMGVERIAMLLHGINAIGLFYENDARFLRQFE